MPSEGDIAVVATPHGGYETAQWQNGHWRVVTVKPQYGEDSTTMVATPGASSSVIKVESASEGEPVTTTEEELLTPTEVQEPTGTEKFDRWFDEFYIKIKPTIRQAVLNQVMKCRAAGCMESKINFSSRSCISCLRNHPRPRSSRERSRSRDRS